MLTTDDFYNDVNPQIDNEDNCMMADNQNHRSYELDPKQVIISSRNSLKKCSNLRNNTEAYLYSQETLYDSSSAPNNSSIYNQLHFQNKISSHPTQDTTSKCPCFQSSHQSIYNDKTSRDIPNKQLELKINEKQGEMISSIPMPPSKPTQALTTFKINSPSVKQNSAFDFLKNKNIPTNVI